MISGDQLFPLDFNDFKIYYRTLLYIKNIILTKLTLVFELVIKKTIDITLNFCGIQK